MIKDTFFVFWTAATTVIYTVAVGTAAMILSFFSKTGKVPYLMAKLWAFLMLKTNRIRIHVQGLEKIDKNRSYVFISNHASNLDPLAVAWTLPHTLRFIAKKSLSRIPFFGWPLRRLKMIFIDRSNSQSSILAINRTIGELKNGISAYFFAEGTRSADGKLSTLKKGGVILALRTKLPVVPITVLDSYKLWPKKSMRIKPGLMRIIVGEPIETSQFQEQDKDLLLQTVTSVIADNLKYNAPIDHNYTYERTAGNLY